MIRVLRLALAVPSDGVRRRLLLTIPVSIVVALLEAVSFGLLFLVLRALDDPAGEGPDDDPPPAPEPV